MATKKKSKQEPRPRDAYGRYQMRSKVHKKGGSSKTANRPPNTLISKFRGIYNKYWTRSTKKPFPFFRLPPEIRNRIYKLALVSSAPTETIPVTSEEISIQRNARPWNPITLVYYRL